MNQEIWAHRNCCLPFDIKVKYKWGKKCNRNDYTELKCVLNERKMYKFVGNDPAFDNNMYRTNRVNAMLLPPERWITALRHKFHQLAHFIQARNLWQHYFGDSLSYSICYYSPFWVVKCALCIWLTSNETRSTTLSPFSFRSIAHWRLSICEFSVK